jgi:hypothetical protein
MCKSVRYLDVSLVFVAIWFAGKRTLKNIRGQVDGKIGHYRTILVRLRDDFLARAAMTTEVTVLRMQDDVSNTTPIRQESLSSMKWVHS